MTVTFAYSGQGSQYLQMGRDLYDTEPVFRRHLECLDSCIADLCGRPVLPTLYAAERQRFEPFTELLYSSLAIFAVERAATHLLLERGLYPDQVVSVSLGILASLVLGECLSDEQAVYYIREQSAIVEQHTQPGVMISVLAGVELLEDLPELIELGEVSGYMFDNCFVLSLPQSALPAVEELLREAKVVFQVMPVSRPFHSRWIDTARSRFLELYEDMPAKTPTLPIWPVDEAAPLKAVSALALWNIVRKPVRFRQTVASLEQRAVGQYVDLGPSGSLATALRYLLPDGGERVSALISPFGHDSVRLQALVSRAAGKDFVARVGRVAPFNNV